MKKVSHRKASESDERVGKFCNLYLFEGKSSLEAYIDTYKDSILKSKASMLVSRPAVQKKLINLICQCDEEELKCLSSGIFYCELKRRVLAYIDLNKVHPVDDYVKLVVEADRKSNPLRNLVRLNRLFTMFEFINREAYTNKIREAILEEEDKLKALKEKNIHYWGEQEKKYKSQIIKEKFHKE